MDPGNEGAHSSTSVPAEREALGNVVDVDSISRPHYEPIDMTTVGLRRSKRRKSEKNKCYSTIKNIGFTAYVRHQRENSNNVGVERDPKFLTSAFKL